MLMAVGIPAGLVIEQNSKKPIHRIPHGSEGLMLQGREIEI